MNSTKALSDRRKYSAEPFFRFTLKNNWQHFALYLIIMVLSIILPVIIMTGEDDITGPALRTHCENIIETAGLLGIMISSVIGVLAGMSSLTFVNSKQMIGCYNSFPIRREGMFLTETSIKAIYYFVGYILTQSTAAIIIKLSFDESIFTEAYEMMLIQFVIGGLMVFIYTYSVFLLSAGLTGTAPVRFIVALLIMFLPAALYALIIACAGIGFRTLYSPYYLSSSVFRVILSPYRLIEAIVSITESNSLANCPNKFANTLFALPESAVYYTAALLLHKFRKSESSGNTIIWKPVFGVVKYSVMFTSGLLGIIAFSLVLSVNGKIAWSIFGMLFGLVIAFMLLNGILYRSAKLIFRNIKGLISVGAVLTLFIFVVVADVFNLNEKTLPLSNTDSITVNVQTDAVSLVIDESESLQSVLPYLRDYIKNYDDTVYYNDVAKLWSNDAADVNRYFGDLISLTEEVDYSSDSPQVRTSVYLGEYMSDNRVFVRIVQKPKFGIPIAKELGIYVNSELWNAICNTPEYKESVSRYSEIDVDDITNIRISFLDYFCTIDFMYSDGIDSDHRTSNPMIFNRVSVGEEYISAAKQITGEILAACRYDESDRENSFIAGYISLLLDEKYPARFPIYSSNTDLINRVMELETLSYNNGLYGTESFIPYDGEFADSAEFAEYVADNYVEAMAIVNVKTGEVRMLDREVYSTLISSGAAVYGADGMLKYFTKPDEIAVDYLILAANKEVEEYAVEEYAKEYYSFYYITERVGGISRAELAAIFDNAG